MKIVNKLKILIRGSMNLDRLKKDGLVVGKNFHAMHGCIIDPGHCFLIKIGDNVTLAPNVHVLAHDASTKIFLNYAIIKKTEIGNNVFVGAGSIILPGITIGSNVIVGAGSVVTKNIPDNEVWAGNPCKKICNLDDFIEKNKKLMKSSNVFDETYKITNITKEKMIQMQTELESGVGYII